MDRILPSHHGKKKTMTTKRAAQLNEPVATPQLIHALAMNERRRTNENSRLIHEFPD